MDELAAIGECISALHIKYFTHCVIIFIQTTIFTYLENLWWKLLPSKTSNYSYCFVLLLQFMAVAKEKGRKNAALNIFFIDCVSWIMNRFGAQK